MSTDYYYIKDKRELLGLCKKLSFEKQIGVDIECENSFHHYGTYISIIQISTEKENFIIDVIALRDIEPLVQIFKNPNIVKIFHNIDFDFRILNYQFNCIPKNIFDTQIAASFLNKTNLGLGNLLEEYFHVQKKCKFQKADWTKRPIKKELLKYAVIDSLYLIKLKHLLTKELEKEHKLKFILEEFKKLENTKRTYSEPIYSDIKGYRSITPIQRSVLKQIFILRNSLAKETDKPVHFIISNKLLLYISKEYRKDEGFWRNLTHVHPIVKKKYLVFMNAVKKGETSSIIVPRKKILRFSEKQKNQMNQLLEVRDKIATEMNVEPHLILNKEMLKKVVVEQKFNSLSKWQKEIISKKFSF